MNKCAVYVWEKTIKYIKYGLGLQKSFKTFYRTWFQDVSTGGWVYGLAQWQ